LLGPRLRELHQRGRGEAHVLDADPLALAVRVVAAREDVRVGRPISVSADPSVPPRIASASARARRGGSPPRGSRRSADPLERVARVAVLDAVLDLDRAARLGGGDLLRERAQERDVLGEAVVLEVADDEAQLDLRGVALNEYGWT
jgi:hypothetical protein